MNINDPMDCGYLFSEVKYILTDNNTQNDFNEKEKTLY